MGAFKNARFAHWGICDACITWGQSTGISTVAGVCTDCSENISLQVQDEPNEYGSTIGKVQTDEIKEATATILVPASTEIPSSIKTPASSVCQLGTVKYFISSISDVQSNRNFRKIQLKLFSSRYVTNGNNQDNCDDQGSK